MRPLLISLPEIVLSMERTVLGKSAGIHVNILTVAISYKGRACPVYWKVFDRKGNSSFEDWKEVLTNLFQKKVDQNILHSVGYIEGLQQMEWLSGKTIHVVADREFATHIQLLYLDIPSPEIYLLAFLLCILTDTPLTVRHIFEDNHNGSPQDCADRGIILLLCC